MLYIIYKMKNKKHSRAKGDQNIEMNIINQGGESLYEKLGKEAVEKRSYLRPLLMKENKEPEELHGKSVDCKQGITNADTGPIDKWSNKMAHVSIENRETQGKIKEAPATPQAKRAIDLYITVIPPTSTTATPENNDDKTTKNNQPQKNPINDNSMTPNINKIPTAPAFCGQPTISSQLGNKQGETGSRIIPTSNAELLKQKLDVRRANMGYKN